MLSDLNGSGGHKNFFRIASIALWLLSLCRFVKFITFFRCCCRVSVSKFSFISMKKRWKKGEATAGMGGRVTNTSDCFDCHKLFCLLCALISSNHSQSSAALFRLGFPTNVYVLNGGGELWLPILQTIVIDNRFQSYVHAWLQSELSTFAAFIQE